MEVEEQRAATAGGRTVRAVSGKRERRRRRGSDGEGLRETESAGGVVESLREHRFVSVPMAIHISPESVSHFTSLLDTTQGTPPKQHCSPYSLFSLQPSG